MRYHSHLLHFDRQEHKSPQMLAMNFRGKLPVLRDDDYVVVRVARDPLLPGSEIPRAADLRTQSARGRRDHARDLRVPVLRRAAAKQIVATLLGNPERAAGDELTEAMHRVAGEARTIEQRLARSDWVVGESFSAADMMIYPDIRLLLRALQRPQAHELAARFLPMEINYPGHRSLARTRRRASRTRSHLAAALAIISAGLTGARCRRASTLAQLLPLLPFRAAQRGTIMSLSEVYVEFPGGIVIVGFGSIGQGVLPLMLRHIGMRPERIAIVTAEESGREEAARSASSFISSALTRENFAACSSRWSAAAIYCSTSRSRSRASR